MSWLITGAEKTPVDPLFSNVSLLLHGDGTNGSTTITDSSPMPKTVTAVGNAQISTAQSKFGGSSIALDGNGDNLTLSFPSSLHFRRRDFTIESFVYLSSGWSTVGNVFHQRGSGSGVTFRLEADGTPSFFYGDGFGSFSSTTKLSVNTWHHIALTRQGNVFRLWLNGSNDGTATLDIDLQGNVNASIGSYYNVPAEYFNGYLDEFRITTGVARYKSAFTPSTVPFPDI